MSGPAEGEPRRASVVMSVPPRRRGWRVGRAARVAAGVAVAALAACALLLAGWEALRLAAGLPAATVGRRPWLSLLLVAAAGGAARAAAVRRRRGAARAARLVALHRLWVDLDLLWGLERRRGDGEAPALLPPLEGEGAALLPGALRERLAGTQALLRQLGGMLGRRGGLGEARLRQALVREAMEAALGDAAALAAEAADSAVPGIALVQEGLRRAARERRTVEVRLTAALPPAEGAVLLCWRLGEAGAVPAAGEVLALGE